jgi:hypothetical protein
VLSALLLVCLLIVAIIGGALLRIGAAERQRMTGEERRLQAEWLVESGLERAAARLAAGGDYAGETWDLAPGDLGRSHPARVTIRVEPVANTPERRLVRVQADYPRDATLRARASKRLELPAGPAEKQKGAEP